MSAQEQVSLFYLSFLFKDVRDSRIFQFICFICLMDLIERTVNLETFRIKFHFKGGHFYAF